MPGTMPRVGLTRKALRRMDHNVYMAMGHEEKTVWCAATGDLADHEAGYAERFELPPYSGSMAAAWEVVRWMQARGTTFRLEWDRRAGLWECAWAFEGLGYSSRWHDPAIAVCDAFLMAFRKEEKVG